MLRNRNEAGRSQQIPGNEATDPRVAKAPRAGGDAEVSESSI